MFRKLLNFDRKPATKSSAERQTAPLALPVELDLPFHSLEEWVNWQQAHSEMFQAPYYESIGAHVLAHGLREPLTGTQVAGTDISRGTDLREGLIYRGINSRQRAVMRIVEQTIDLGHCQELRIYAPEAVTAMALRLRGTFPKFIGSEWTDDPVRKRNMYPIPFEDLTQLTLASDSIDLVLTNEVLEHVPDVDAALHEVARVLKPGCWHIGTCPLIFSENSIIKTRIVDGQLVHLMEPEYHGDPFNDKGSLVFELPGWNILARARAAGFSEALLRLVISQQHGYVSETAGIYVLCCRK